MRQIAQISKAGNLGIEGAEGTVSAALSVDAGNLVAEVSGKATFPIAKVIDPATKAVDNLLDKLEQAIPGDWDKPMIEGFKAEYKADLIKFISGS